MKSYNQSWVTAYIYIYTHTYFSVISAVSNVSPSCPLRVLSITYPKNLIQRQRKMPPWTPAGGELLRKLHLSREKCVHMWVVGWKCLYETSSHSCSQLLTSESTGEEWREDGGEPGGGEVILWSSIPKKSAPSDCLKPRFCSPGLFIRNCLPSFSLFELVDVIICL